jgi:hypothetical protein
MRWLFYDPNDPDEGTKHDAVLSAIGQWWRAFESKTSQIDALFSRKSEWDLPDWMQETLQAIDPHLMWEYGPAVNQRGHRLVITPEAERHLRPLTAAILEQAPQIVGWEFYGYRLPESVEMANESVKVRTGGNLEGVVVDVGLGEHHLIDLVFRSPRSSGGDDTQASNDAFVATESLLGEEMLDKWIGRITVDALPKQTTRTAERPSASRGIALEELKSTVDAVVGATREQLPAESQSFRIADAKWSMLELKPKEADDYSARTDLFVAVTANLEMWMAAHSDMPFSSQRFSRCGETFAYVKLDGSQELTGSEFSDRGEIEEALDNAFKAESLGCTLGGGTGLRYSYIDLALSDLHRGVEIACRVLNQGRVPHRSWIQFFDSDLCGEWVGIYPNSPIPPMDRTDD